MVQQLDIQDKTPSGLLSEVWLHPTSLLGNPYSAACANSTHRQEFWWQLRVYTTSASFTGARVAVLALPDPSYSGGLSAGTVWGAVANGRGSMIDTSGNRTRDARFQIQGSTSMLSNARPPANMNMLGYADAVLITWLLQPPIALGQDSKINVTIMARCCLQGKNPVPGYLLAQLPHPTQQPDSRPNPGQRPDWILVKDHSVGPLPGDYMGDWAVWHTGDAWLAGGWYFSFKSAHGQVPTPSAQDPKIKGEPCWGCVYVSSDVFPEWETNRQHRGVPKYFACYLSPISRYVFLVGFTNFDWAQAQASGHTGLVPPDVELCITYTGSKPKWSQFSGDTDVVRTYFYEIWRADPGRVGQVYSSTFAITDSDYPQDTYALAPRASPNFTGQALAQPWLSLFHPTASTTNSLSGTTGSPWSREHLLLPRYSTARAGSMTSTASSSSWSCPQEEVAPTAPPMTLAELCQQLTKLATVAGGQFIPPDLPPVNPYKEGEGAEDDDTSSSSSAPQSQTSISTPELEPYDIGPDAAPPWCPQASNIEAPGQAPQPQPESSPPPAHENGLPNWTQLWLRALHYAGQAPAGPFLP